MASSPWLVRSRGLEWFENGSLPGSNPWRSRRCWSPSCSSSPSEADNLLGRPLHMASHRDPDPHAGLFQLVSDLRPHAGSVKVPYAVAAPGHCMGAATSSSWRWRPACCAPSPAGRPSPPSWACGSAGDALRVLTICTRGWFAACRGHDIGGRGVLCPSPRLLGKLADRRLDSRPIPVDRASRRGARARRCHGDRGLGINCKGAARHGDRPLGRGSDRPGQRGSPLGQLTCTPR